MYIYIYIYTSIYIFFLFFLGGSLRRSDVSCFEFSPLSTDRGRDRLLHSRSQQHFHSQAPTKPGGSIVPMPQTRKPQQAARWAVAHAHHPCRPRKGLRAASRNTGRPHCASNRTESRPACRPPPQNPHVSKNSFTRNCSQWAPSWFLGSKARTRPEPGSSLEPFVAEAASVDRPRTRPVARDQARRGRLTAQDSEAARRQAAYSATQSKHK